jgi:hypothetical protein
MKSSYDLLEGVILFLLGIILLSFTIYKYRYEKKESIVNEYQLSKNIISLIFAIAMIIFGLNKIF